MSNEGKYVMVHYVGAYDDGTIFDSSEKHGEALKFKCMAGMMIPGFDKAVSEMEVGEERQVRLEPADAYGEIDPELIQEVPVDEFPNSDQLPVGQSIYIQDGEGGAFPAKVVSIENGIITFDLNHPMAGKALNFQIALADVSDEPFPTMPGFGQK